MMLGLLLARMGVDVVVLEKHRDFLRDFRGDTIHPSTLQVMHELGILEGCLALPHSEVARADGQIGTETVPIADFSHLPLRCRFIAFMPQWDFLDFLAAQGRRYRHFHLMMNAEGLGLLTEADRVVGVSVRTPDGPVEIRADLVVAADGRRSTMRDSAGLCLRDLGAPMDVLWLRLSRRAEDPETALGRVGAGRILVMLNRGDYWQCAVVIRKGAAEDIRGRGLEAFRAQLVQLAPDLRDRVAELRDWDSVKLLTVSVDRLDTWYRPGLLCIGDAAHAMSPIGGVGINLAIQDAVATANIIGEPLYRRALGTIHLRQVQRRREWPTRVTQKLQLVLQNRVISRVLSGTRVPRVPWQLRLLQRFPVLRRIPARLIGMGVQPEHVRTPDRGTAGANP